ncbi:GTP 3',8-cyclase MoaA [Terrisporobacter glycolicus]|uniref:GTP 3',8-cyclase n=1 Tax=Terrisporobacter glycolicus ATCC 14880 = DSM 1288 TaxID=1121315 RepID=A0ABZ2EWC7_9FIRM|nr:GTP 3',8-cyclase MoaA [Terrisporobacter glycolicus]
MIDKFGREIDYLRISVTENCNLKCIYCIDDNNILNTCNKDILNDDEIIKIVTQCAILGIKKIRITGGEPLVRKNIENLIYRLSNIEGIEEIYITTNGVLLHDKLEILERNGLSGVNISLDSLRKNRFKELTKFDKLSQVLSAIDKALKLGLKVKINTVIVDDINKDEIIDFINLTKNKNLALRFIELMPIGAAKKHKRTNNKEILNIIKSNFKNVKKENKIERSGPANYIKIEGYKGKVGFISPISSCFCEDCNRIRLTSSGFLKKCLHYNYGVDLKRHLDNKICNEELNALIYENIYDKPEKHLFLEICDNKENKYMNQIGG